MNVGSGENVTDPNEGWQRVKVDVDLDGVPDAAFDLFLTHLDATTKLKGKKRRDKDRTRRRKQIDKLVDRIEARQNAEWALPKVVMGDMNIWSTKLFENDDLAAYETLLRQMDSVGMQSAWETYGGPANGKNECEVLDRTPRLDGHQDCRATCHCDPFHEGDVGDGWLDYVFIEEPRDHHAINLDISRMWQVPTNVKECDCLSDRVAQNKMNKTVDDGPYLTDHAGLGFELLTSPK